MESAQSSGRDRIGDWQHTQVGCGHRGGLDCVQGGIGRLAKIKRKVIEHSVYALLGCALFFGVLEVLLLIARWLS